MKECIAMLLAGGQGSRLGLLTKKVAKQLGPDKSIIVCLSGRGDKDVMQVKERLETERK